MPKVPARVHIIKLDEDIIHCGGGCERPRGGCIRLLHLITVEENILDFHLEKCLCREAATTISMCIEGR